jgi:hypothetical protein
MTEHFTMLGVVPVLNQASQVGQRPLKHAGRDAHLPDTSDKLIQSGICRWFNLLVRRTIFADER